MSSSNRATEPASGVTTGISTKGLSAGSVGLIGAVVMAFAYQLSRSRGLPIVLIILGVLVLAYSVVTNRTVFGRHVYSIGGNLHAAQLSGVKVKKVNTLNRKGKRVRSRRSPTFGKRPDTKRAIVTLADGERIDLFEA